MIGPEGEPSPTEEEIDNTKQPEDVEERMADICSSFIENIKGLPEDISDKELDNFADSFVKVIKEVMGPDQESTNSPEIAAWSILQRLNTFTEASALEPRLLKYRNRYAYDYWTFLQYNVPDDEKNTKWFRDAQPTFEAIGAEMVEKREVIESEMKEARKSFLDKLKVLSEPSTEVLDKLRGEHFMQIEELSKTDSIALNRSENVAWRVLQRLISFSIAATLNEYFRRFGNEAVDNLMEFLEDVVPDFEREQKWYKGYFDYTKATAKERGRLGIPKP